jgi:hypothetical protein
LKVDLFYFKFFEKDAENYANTSRMHFLVFYSKWSKKLGSNKCPLFTILTEKRLVKCLA